MYSSGLLHTSDLPAREHFENLFDANHVNLVLTGHAHNYERTYPVVNGQRTGSGPVYIVTGGGGATLYPGFVATPAWSAMRSATHLRFRGDRGGYRSRRLR